MTIPNNGEKSAVRRQMLAVRRRMEKEQAQARSSSIEARVMALPELAAAESIFCYLAAQNEAETRGIIGRLLAAGKRVYVPAVKDGMMSAVRFNADSRLVTGAFGIEEPEWEAEKAADTALALIPGVAFDEGGGRLGYGGGYYDRWLKNSRAVKVALAYDFQIVPALPREPHDVLMDIIVTDKRVIQICGQT